MPHRSPNLHVMADILVTQSDTSSLPVWDPFHDEIDEIAIDPTDRVRPSKTRIRGVAITQEELSRKYRRNVGTAINELVDIMGQECF